MLQHEIEARLQAVIEAMGEEPYQEIHHKAYVDLLLESGEKTVDENLLLWHRNWTPARYRAAITYLKQVAEELSVTYEWLIGTVRAIHKLNMDIPDPGEERRNKKFNWPEFWACVEFIFNEPFPVKFDRNQPLFKDSNIEYGDTGYSDECSGCYS